MDILKTAFKYLKRHILLSATILCSITLASLFEGAGLGALIPLVQSMTNSANILEKIPAFLRFGFVAGPDGQAMVVSLIFVLLFIALLLKNVFTYLYGVMIAKMKLSTTRDLSVDLMNGIIEYDIKYFDGAKTGHIMNSFNTETARMGQFVSAFLEMAAVMGKVAAYLALLFLISWKVSIVIFVLIACILIPLEFIMKRIKRIGEAVSVGLSAYSFNLLEILNGIRLIKGSGTEDIERRRFKSAVDRVYELWYTCNKYTNLILPISEVLVVGLVVIFFIIMINVTKIDIRASFPFMATYMLVLVRMLTQLNALNIQRSMVANNFAAFACYEEIADKKEKKTIESGTGKIRRFSDEIVFENVSFSYRPGKKVLRNINIRIPRGKILAIIGASGAGKSTIVNLIPRFYDVTSGRITIDGLNLKDLDLKAWRRKIGIVSQDTFIFNATARENIIYGCPSVSEEEIVAAAQAAHAHEFVSQLPNKYETILGERGAKLSGGQKQRISIARAIMHNPEILILDEATSSLDTETERLIKDAVDKVTKGRTVIAIAHRISTIIHADQIIVLDNGEIAEYGDHAKLIELGGVYKKLYEEQFVA